jgi:hypothetical protein
MVEMNAVIFRLDEPFLRHDQNEKMYQLMAAEQVK